MIPIEFRPFQVFYIKDDPAGLSGNKRYVHDNIFPMMVSLKSMVSYHRSNKMMHSETTFYHFPDVNSYFWFRNIKEVQDMATEIFN